MANEGEFEDQYDLDFPIPETAEEKLKREIKLEVIAEMRRSYVENAGQWHCVFKELEGKYEQAPKRTIRDLLEAQCKKESGNAVRVSETTPEDLAQKTRARDEIPLDASQDSAS